MPTKPKTPCKHPGCPELVEAGRKYCDKHKPLHPEEIRSPSERGYDSRWRKARKTVAESKEEIPGGSSAVRGVYEGRSVRESY